MIYMALSAILTSIIAAKLFEQCIGPFELINFSNRQSILDFFMKGNFIIASLLFIGVYQFLYELLRILIDSRMYRYTDQLFDYLKHKFDGQKLLNEVIKNKILLKLAFKGIKKMKELNFIEESESGLKLGVAYKDLLHFFKRLNSEDEDEREDLDLDNSFYPMMFSLQFIILFDWIVVPNNSIHIGLIILVHLIAALSFCFHLIGHFVNVFVDMKKHHILNFLEKEDYKRIFLNKSQNNLKQSNDSNPENTNLSELP
jgi:hypothetical protein